MTFLMISRIPDILNERNMTVSDLHEQMNKDPYTELSYQSLIRLASKKQPIIPSSTKIETLHKIAVALGVKVDDLYTVQEI